MVAISKVETDSYYSRPHRRATHHTHVQQREKCFTTRPMPHHVTALVTVRPPPQVESLAELEEVQRKIKPCDTVGVNLEGKLRKDDDSSLVDMDKVQKVADFLKAVNGKGVAVTELYLSSKRATPSCLPPLSSFLLVCLLACLFRVCVSGYFFP